MEGRIGEAVLAASIEQTAALKLASVLLKETSKSGHLLLVNLS